MGNVRRAALAAILLAGISGCSPPRPGQLTGKWVAVAGTDGASLGTAAPPTAARPLAVTAGPQGCFDDAILSNEFGPRCRENEPEAQATSTMSDDVTTGNHPTPGEVRWYCDKRTVVRIVIERCGTANQFRVRQIAVSIQP
jgi:hypothetical protein